jgi:anti-sigma factor (TIGR02949 family)
MTDCRRAIARLWELLDGELAPEEADEIRRHLTACAACKPQYRRQLRFLNALVTAHAERDLPRPEFVSRLKAALQSLGGDVT